MLPQTAEDDIVVISWDGRSTPLGNIGFDEEPKFKGILFCYMADGEAAVVPAGWRLLNIRTECKGQIFSAVIDHIGHCGAVPGYVGLIDDDVELPVSAINRMLLEGRQLSLASFSATLSKDSIGAHRKFFQDDGPARRTVPWVEVMAPFYQWSLLRALSPLIEGNVSSYGIDQFAAPTVQKLLGLGESTLFNDVTMRHRRPITSDRKRFSNGRTAHEERRLLRRACMQHVKTCAPHLVGSRWWRDCFAPWDGPWTFLSARLAVPRPAGISAGLVPPG